MHQRGDNRMVATRLDPAESRYPASLLSRSIEPFLPELRERIRFLVETAVANQSTISVSELRSLMPENRFPNDGVLKQFLVTDERLSRLVAEIKGELTLRGREGLANDRRAQRLRAHDRLSQADDFLRSLGKMCPWIELAGISGSTAYAGAKPEDDIDFFLVTAPRRLWISLLLAMTTARIRRIRSRNSPILCFNRLVERNNCIRTFRESREPLLAREALNLVVLRGNRLYRRLLASAPWMGTVFPEMFARRLPEAYEEDEPGRGRRLALGSLANAAAFLFLAPYLWMGGTVRNVRLQRAGRDRERFRTVVRPELYATESIVYEELREKYRKAFA